MLTMTRIPSGSFLPSGAMLDPSQRPMPFASHLTNHPSTSVISPLSLPRAVNHLSYMDESNLTNLPPSGYSHSSPGSEAPRSQQQHLSPHPAPQYLRGDGSDTLSPSRHQIGSGVASPSMVPSVSAPFQNMSTQSLVNLLQRREDQNRRLLENWRAERAHLEASRARAEEVYREERAIMDDERILWAEEKAKLERDLCEWKKKAELVEKERDQFASLVQSMQGKAGHASKSFDGVTETSMGSIRGGGLSSPGAHSQSTGRFWSSTDSTSTGSLLPDGFHGSTMPESQPFVPLDPRMQGLSPRAGSPKPEQDQIPSIDIQEVIPGLEGIRVRPNIVQKVTFSDGNSLSPSSAPQSSAPHWAPAPMAKPELPRARTMPADLTKEALLAPESDRLTMHAGHTPNHSMSLSRLHTVESTKTNNTADSSGSSTPKCGMPKSEQSKTSEHTAQNQMIGASGASETLRDIEAQEKLEAERDQDPELKGPLHLRNLPAADEPFLQALADKLTHAATNDPTPTVLKNEHSVEPSEAEAVAKADGDGAQGASEEPAEIEEDIPLKLKQSSNFGAPLGQFWKSSRF